MRRMLGVLASVSVVACAIAQQPGTSPANESRVPVSVRSPNSIGADLKVPLCPQHFHDGLTRNGIAAQNEKDVTPAGVKKTVPALMTQQAIAASGNTHIGNFSVIVDATVDTKGMVRRVCLVKSSGYGLDASAATAVAQYVFEPATKNGRPVKYRVPVEVRFVTQTPPSMTPARSGLPPK